MTMLASQDGQIIGSEEATVPVTDEGLIFGDGVFEVVRLYNGRPFALSEHFARMTRSSRNLHLELDLTSFEREIEELLRIAEPRDAILRLIATRGGHRFAILEELKTFPDSFALVTVEYAPPLLLDGIKSLSYGANMLATRIAQERGADEALLVDPEDRVLEAPTSSLFYAIKTGELFTPPLSDHILDSITRRHVIAASGAKERSLMKHELADLSEAFVASSVREVLPVRSIDGRELQAPGSLTEAAAAGLMRRIMSLL